MCLAWRVHHEGSVRDLYDVDEFIKMCIRIEIDRDRSGLVATQEQNEVVGLVVHKQRHGIVGCNALGHKAVSEVVGPAVQFAVGHGLVAPHDRGAVCDTWCYGLKYVSDVEGHSGTVATARRDDQAG